MRIPILIVLLLFTACNASQKLSKSQQASIQKTLNDLVAKNKIPGINFSYIDSLGNQYDFAAGYENTKTQTSLQTTHKMFSGSVGKTYVAAIVLQLVEEGKFNLEDKVLQHLPKYKWLQRLPNINDITIEMLLSHTSGLPRWVLKPAVWETLAKNPNKIWTYEDQLYHIFDHTTLHKAGESWAYSDTNYILLGLLIETVLNQKYADIIHARILQPYNLNDTQLSDSRDINRLAMGYSELPAFFQIPNQVINSEGLYFAHPQFEWTGGGMVSTTADLAKWTKLYYTSDIIPSSFKTKMTTINPHGKNVMSGSDSYGMGSFIYTINNQVAYVHGGLMPGYNTLIAYFPKTNQAFAFQVNCDYAGREMSLKGYLGEVLRSLEL